MKINNLQKSVMIERLENPPTGVPRYTINGEGYFSVTQILDDGKFKDLDPNKMIHSLTLGSVVHLQIENFLKNFDLHHNIQNVLEEKQLLLYNFLREATVDEWEHYLTGIQNDNSLEEIVLKNRINTAYNQFLDFLNDHELEVMFAEEVIWNPDYLYAGTIDLVCILDGELTIIDHKTSRFVNTSKDANDKYTGQLSAYLNAIKKLEEKEDLNINLNILHLNPISKSYKVIKRSYNFEKFLYSMSRFSQDKILHEQISNNTIELKKDIDSLYFTKFYDCPDKRCKQKSGFPFPKNCSYLVSNKVKKIIKVMHHENENHFAVYHLSVPHFKVKKSFIKKIDI